MGDSLTFEQGRGGDNKKYHQFFVRNCCAGVFWPVHLLEASFGRMLCISCIFVMVVELTLATFFLQFLTFVVIHLCVFLRLPRGVI